MEKLLKLGIATIVSIFVLLSCKSVQIPVSTSQATPEIIEKRWKLVELNGEEIKQEGQHKEVYFILHREDKRISGNGGCNSFSGAYTLSEEGRISFSSIISTMMACPDMEIETRLLKVLEMTDNYTLKDNTLSLNKARMAPLAKFALSEQ